MKSTEPANPSAQLKNSWSPIMEVFLIRRLEPGERNLNYIYQSLFSSFQHTLSPRPSGILK